MLTELATETEERVRRMLEWPNQAAGRLAADYDLAFLLATYRPITLGELTAARLMDRAELKYLMSQNVLGSLLSELRPFYRMLTVAGRRLSGYRTLYYDTADLALYRRHHDGAADRYKIRAREYVETHMAFLEVKHRTPKQRTVKSRIPMQEFPPALTPEAAGFVTRSSPYRAADLRPALWNDYRRVTLVAIAGAERVTLDLDLSFEWDGTHIALPGILVAEVKYEGDAHQSPFVAAMRRRGIHRTSFSKYCIGISLTYPTVKANSFKKKHLLIDRLMREGDHGLH